MKPTLRLLHLTVSMLMLAGLSQSAAGSPWSAVGRPATPAEIKAWDIDVRADFKGLPKGSGTVSQGEKVWEGKCASCHGTFAESNQIFTPIVGGTTADDIKTGHVASLVKGDVPQRTTLMKLAHLSTMWDYINRAMPWNAPKSLTTDEVYAATAYILNLAEIVPADFTLSDKNIAEVQNRLPNRNGLTRVDGMWNTRGKGDVLNVACMKNCETEVKIGSSLPDYARNAHGNLADQNRLIGETRGTNTGPIKAGGSANDAKALAVPRAEASGVQVAKVDSVALQIPTLLKENGCTACHAVDSRVVGPSFREVAAKYKGKADLETYLAGKIKHGGAGVWGAIPMPPQAQIKDGDIKAIAQWLAAGAK